MSIVSTKELFRKGVFEVNKNNLLYREWVCVLSDDAIASPITDPDVATALGIDLGTRHPVYNAYRVRKVTITEGHGGSPYHVHVAAEYGIVLDNDLLAPTSRAAKWEFDSTPSEVPAFYYFSGSGNNTTLPLTNSAYDYFPGLVTQEAMVAIKVSKNFATLPLSWLAAQNFVNNATYMGCAPHTLTVQKVTVTQETEDLQGQNYAFWKATAEIQFRQSSHNLFLPDIGFNFLDNGQKRRCMVYDFQNETWIPSPNPVGLNGSGAQTGGTPAILNRRVKPETSFQALFGTPPTTPVS